MNDENPFTTDGQTKNIKFTIIEQNRSCNIRPDESFNSKSPQTVQFSRDHAKELALYLLLLLLLKAAKVTADDLVEFPYILGNLFVCVGFVLISYGYLVLAKCHSSISRVNTISGICVVNAVILYLIFAEENYILFFSDKDIESQKHVNDLLIVLLYFVYSKTIPLNKWLFLLNISILSLINTIASFMLMFEDLGSFVAVKLSLFIAGYLACTLIPMNARNYTRAMSRALLSHSDTPLVDDFNKTDLDHALGTCDGITETLQRVMGLMTSREIRKKVKKSLREIKKIKQNLAYGAEVDYIPDIEMDEEDRAFYREHYTKTALAADYKTSRKQEENFSLYHLIQNQAVSSTTIDESILLSLVSGVGKVWNFDMWLLHSSLQSTILPIAEYIFEHWSLYSELSIPRATVEKFFNRLENKYISHNTYHNACHASDVLSSLMYFITHSKLMEELDLTETLGCLIAALGHDVGHPGVNNRFLVNTGEKLALKYNDISVLENMHCYVIFKIMKEEDCNVLGNLGKIEYDRIRKLIVGMILGTDMANHFETYNRLKGLLNTQNIDMGRFNDKVFILSVALKCADIGHSAKTIEIHRGWTERISEEFFKQGDLEKANEMPVSMWFDREHANLPKSQIGFLRHICLPLFEEWSRFLSADDIEIHCVAQLKENISYWESLDFQRLGTSIQERDYVGSSPARQKTMK